MSDLVDNAQPQLPRWQREHRAAKLLSGLRSRGVSLSVHGKDLEYTCAEGALSPGDKQQLKDLKADVLRFLAAEAELNDRPRRSYVLRGDEWIENDNGVEASEVLSHLFTQWQQERAQQALSAPKAAKRPRPPAKPSVPSGIPLRPAKRPPRPTKGSPRICRHCGTNFDAGKDLSRGTSGKLPRGWDVHIDPADRSMFCTCGPRCRVALGLKAYR